MKTTLINYRECDIGDVLEHEKIIPIDRRSIFGNPFKIGKYYTRETCIKEYKIDFYKRLDNPWFKEQVLKLKGETLGCWCTPLPCHGDVIIEYLEGLE